MTAMTPRDALEAVRNRLLTAADDFDRLHDQEGWKPTADLLREAAQALVERAGEPVACDAIPAHEWETLSVEASEYDSSLEHAWKRCVRCGTRVHVTRDTLPPTAPGASHER